MTEDGQYKKGIAMKELMIEELFAGAWVGMRDEKPGVPHMMQVYGLWKDGDLFMASDEDEHEPSLSNIHDVCGLCIDEDVLSGFGFVLSRKDKDVWVLNVGDFKLTCSLRWHHGIRECRRCSFSGRASNWNEDIRCVHELQRWWTDKVAIPYGVRLELKLKDSDYDRTGQ